MPHKKIDVMLYWYNICPELNYSVKYWFSMYLIKKISVNLLKALGVIQESSALKRLE